jgi:hypothetical protein
MRIVFELIFLLLILGVFYFLIIRPRIKKLREQKEEDKNMKGFNTIAVCILIIGACFAAQAILPYQDFKYPSDLRDVIVATQAIQGLACLIAAIYFFGLSGKK